MPVSRTANKRAPFKPASGLMGGKTPRAAGLPHAGRVGAARGDVAGMAAQSRRLAGKIPIHPVALCGDRAPACRARARASDRGRRGDGAARDQHARAADARISMPVSFHHWPTDRGWTRDSGPIFVRNAAGKVGHYTLALQRMGEVRRLASRRQDSRPRGEAAGLSGSGNQLSKTGTVRSTGWCWKAGRLM